MLRFIAGTRAILDYLCKFQYIPCYGLSIKQWRFPNHANISIHPMLRFIRTAERYNWSVCKFQYIPCYGLSVVTRMKRLRGIEFQYIPCYGLSRTAERYNWSVCEFQYIPCYGLSPAISIVGGIRANFNTSHVTVYLAFSSTVKNVTFISIHPMLRFIISVAPVWTCLKAFQYIPCYGLSNLEFLRMMLGHRFQYIPCYGLSNVCFRSVYRGIISIHPMLRFILCCSFDRRWRIGISIHPMLRFIHLVSLSGIKCQLFQYIPCYGLSGNQIDPNTGLDIFQYIPCYGLSRWP